jgi:hypothetical protein
MVTWDGEDKKYLQNFGEEVSWKSVSWSESYEGNFVPNLPVLLPQSWLVMGLR